MHRVFETIVKPLFNIEINYIEDRRIGTNTLLARVYRHIGTGPSPGIIEVHDGARISNNLKMAAHTQRTIKIAAKTKQPKSISKKQFKLSEFH